MKNKKTRVKITGMVQGVGFRAFIYRNASLLGITGWAKNTGGGGVEAVFEGEEKQVHKLIELCRQGPAAGKVDRVEVREEPFLDEFTAFRIEP